MNKQLIILIIILSIVSINFVSAGNNTTPINNPTAYITDQPTIEALENGDSNISFQDGYKGYCVEWGEHSAEQGEQFYVEPTTQITNTQTGDNVSNYLKAMFLFFYNQTQQDTYATQHMVWKFTDNKQFSRFNQTWYNQIVDVGSQYNIPDDGNFSINATHIFCFSFKAFIAHINEYQNFFAYKFFIQEKPTNATIQIINNSINNSINTSSNYQNNDSYIQYDDSVIQHNNKNIITHTLNNKETGICIYPILIIIFIISLFCIKRKII